MNRFAERPRGLRWWPLGVGLVLVVAFNLRPTLTSVGPLLPEIGHDMGFDEGLKGLLGTLPLLAFAVFSPILYKFSDRFGIERTMFIALITLAAGTVIRSFFGAGGLWVGTLILGCAITVGNVLIPAIVQRDFPLRVSQVTGLYTAALTVVASIASAIAVPLSSLIGWQGSLAVWAIPAFIAALFWLPRAKLAPVVFPSSTAGEQLDQTQRAKSSTVETSLETAPQTSPSEHSERAGPVWRRTDAWLVTAFMGLQSLFFYVMITWLPTIRVAAGATLEEAGVHLFVFIIVGIVSSLTIPRLMHDPENLALAGVVSSGPALVALLGFLFLPALGLMWAIIAGLSAGACLVYALSLISYRGRTSRETTRLGGMAQSIGYLFAAIGPIGVGYLVQFSGSWHLALIVVSLMSVAQITVSVLAGKSRSPR